MKSRILSEQESRRNILGIAREHGCLNEVIEIFKKYDRLLVRCTNDQERQHMSALANIELHKMLGNGRGILEINGQVVYDNMDDTKLIEKK